MKIDTSVTGIMVTGKTKDRYPLARLAVQAWLAQEYPGPRELLIINDHPTAALFPNTIPTGVREIRITGRYSLGELRNLGIEYATHDYLVQWDDDDYSHPARLGYQVTNTETGGASMFLQEIHCNLFTGQAFVNNGKSIRGGGFPGTMLWPRLTNVRFPALGKAEDTEFILMLRKEVPVVVLLNDPAMYFRCYHGLNTWSEQHVMKHKPGSRLLDEIESIYVYHLLNGPYREIVTELRAKTN